MSTFRGLRFGVVAALLVTWCFSDRASSAQSTAPRSTPAPVEVVPTASEPASATEPAVRLDVNVFPGSIVAFKGIDVWVDPVHGVDSRDGRTRSTALRTIDAAWRRVPAGVRLATGYRLRLVAGHYPQATSVNYWENRHGTAAAPIIIEAADGAHSAVFDGDINMFQVSYFALVGVDVVRNGDAFHCEECDHVLIRNAELSGGTGAHETVKVNQSQYLFIEGSDIHGADDNAIDFVAVQYAHVTGNRIHAAQDWCMYAKGGSAYITISGNEVYDCGTGGVTAGQGTGFEFMVAPWLQYEAYGIRITGNVVHDTEGAGLGVNGGYDVLLAGNTLYHVGTRSHLVEFVYGHRSCDGDRTRCAAHRAGGGWGPSDTSDVLIPNRHVYFVNNIVAEPTGVRSQWQHFQISGPTTQPPTGGVPAVRADDDLRILGNVIWNGTAEMPLGVGDGSGCAASNPTCNATQLVAANRINTWQPQLRDPVHGDYRLTVASAAAMPTPVPVPSFVWTDAPAGVRAPAVWP